MSIVIFFGMALFIFLGGVTVLSVTFYSWYKSSKEAKQKKATQFTQAPVDSKV